MRDTNIVHLKGTLLREFSFLYQDIYHDYYSTEILVDRLSGKSDRLPLLIREDKLIETTNKIELIGQIRTHDIKDSIELFVYVDTLENSIGNMNQVDVSGSLCKKPIYKVTPQGREVAELLLAVRREYNKSSYIHCICWGNLARISQKLYVGAHISGRGRLQSRDYVKDNKFYRVYELALQSFILN